MTSQSLPPAPIFQSGSESRIVACSVLVVWALVAVAYVTGMYPEFDGIGSTDTDVILRQVQVRDFLAGQGWFDLMQRRMNAPFGLVMHWSRLIDAPIAGLILGLEPFLGRRLAEVLAMTIWPLFLIGPLLGIVALLGYRLGGENPAGRVGAAILGALFVALSPATIAHFRVGGTDHHNVQIVAFIAMIWLTIAAPSRPRMALILGLIMGLMIAIGLEALPFILVAIGIIALGYVFAPEMYRNAARLLGASIAITTSALYVALVGFPFAAPNMCDAISPLYLAFAVVGGGGLALLTTMRLPSNAARFCALGTLAAVLIGITWAMAPECFGGPLFMLDARLREIWFDEVNETKSILKFLALEPGTEVVAKFGVPVFALIGACVMIARASSREQTVWVVIGVNLLVSTGLAALQIRYAAFSNALAAPVAAAIAVRAYDAATTSGGLMRMGAASLTFLAACPIVWLIIGANVIDPIFGNERGVAKNEYDRQAMECLSPEAHTRLDQLEPGVILNSFNLGTSILLHTRHSVVAGHYHRNTDGMNAVIDAFMGDNATARAIAEKRQARYVVTCAGDNETASWVQGAPDGFMARLLRDEPISWIQPVDRLGKIHIWEIRP